MTANKNIFAFARVCFTTLLLLSTLPTKIVEARIAESPTTRACAPIHVANEYTAQSTEDTYPLPVEPVEVYFEYDGTSRVIQGRVAPDTELTVEAWNQGVKRWTKQTRTDASGFYRVPSSAGDCLGGNNYTVGNGYQVEVTAGEATYRMVPHQFTGLVDPINNSVSGPLANNLVVDITLEEPLPSAGCTDSAVNTITGTAAASSGRFRAVLEDFGARAVATLRVRDGDGSSILPHPAEQITLNRDTGGFYGSMEPSPTVTFTYTLTRGGEMVETKSMLGSSYISHKFTQPLQPGDVIEVSRSGQVLYHAEFVPFSAAVDLDTDKIYGETSPGRPVIATLGDSYGNAPWFNRCGKLDMQQYCAQAGEDGAYTLQVSADIRQGDQGKVEQYDEYGNAQVMQLLTGGYIHLDLSRREVAAYLPGITNTQKTVSLRYQDAVLWQAVNSSTNPAFWTLPTNLQALPGAMITVTDGVQSIALTVPEVSLDPLYGGSEISGSAPDGMVRVEQLIQDPDRESFTCSEVPVEGGWFSAPTGDRSPITGINDFWFTHSNGAGGYYTFSRASRFLVTSMNIPGAYIMGSVEQPGQNVTLTHLRGNNTVGDYTFTSNPSSAFNGAIPGDSAFTQGDRIVVSTDGAVLFEVKIPQQSGWVENVRQRIVAFAPESARVLATVAYQQGEEWETSGFLPLTPDGKGYFQANLSTLRRSNGCPMSPANGCPRVTLYSFTPEGDLIGWDGPEGAAVADMHEPDDTRETAQEYQDAPQHHSILALNEDDWIRFEVSKAEADEVFTITLENMGANMILDYEISSDNGNGQRITGTFSDGGLQQMDFKPSTPGVYYLRLKAAGEQAAYGSCDSTYDLTIQRPVVLPTWEIYLPAVIQ